jgi:hypothetical protein
MSDTPEQPGQAPADQPAPGLTPAANEKELKEARAEAAKYRTELRKVEAEREAERQRKAEEAGEFQRLYETEKQQRQEVEARAARAEALETALTAHVKELARDLPEDLRALMPEASPDVQLEWLTRARKAAAKLTEQRTPGTPPGPKGNGTVTPTTPDLVAQKRASGIY